MPEFQRKTSRFTHQGQQWNKPVDAIPEGQNCLGINIRSNQHDSVTNRPGLTTFVTIASGSEFVHTIATLNNFNTDLTAFSKVYVVSAKTAGSSVGKLFVGAAAGNLTTTAQNPIKMSPAGTTFGLSGDPLTLVDMAPVGTNIGWKYIGDSAHNYSVGYYPGDSTTNGVGNNSGMARCLTMGMTPPVYTGIPASAGGGLLIGDYQWMFAYRNKFTGARSNPSAPSRVTQAAPALTLASEQASFTVPATPDNPQNTGTPDSNVIVDIYRFGGTIQDWRYVGTADSGVSFTDNLPDSDILTSEAPPQVTDANGVTRFNLFRPFVVQDNARYNSVAALGTVTKQSNGTWTLNAGASTVVFDLDWLPGSAISINNKIFHIYQVITTVLIEIVEDATGSLTSGSTNNPWATQTGTLKAGSPLPHIWGPYGTGFGGAYIFGCGGAHSDAGTLYWANGNDPDSADIANSLVVTSPSEPLRGGCVYDGTPFVFSTERMFRIYPGNVAGQFTVQEIPGGKGLWAEYSLTVQSNAIADQSISWVGKDGIYDWSTSGGLRTLTDRDMYPFFPHDNQVGVDFLTLFPFATGAPSPINAPDFSTANLKYHRLCWYQGELFYDYPCIVSASNKYNTLVYDTKEAGGWVSVDQYTGTSTAISAAPVCRGIEIAASNMKVAVGVEVLNYTGDTDAGASITSRLITRQDDMGDPRAQKLYGDFMLDVVSPGGLTITPRTNPAGTAITGQSVTTAVRLQTLFATVSTGLGTLASSFGLDLTWNSVATTLYQWEYSYVGKPEITGKRATDKTDDGYNGAKYLRGLCIESNTFSAARTVHVLVDGADVATLTVTTASQLELPFAITPLAGSEFQLQPTDTASWELFQVRWVWEKWPDLTVIQSNWMDMGTSKPKYVRSFTIPISAPASPTLTFTATYDGASTYTTTAVAPASITAKTSAQFSFNPPILAHQLKLTPSTPCRVWYESIVWDAEEWPEIALLYGPVEKLGDSGAKYLRGFELPIETGGNSVVMKLLYDNQPNAFTGITVTEALAAVSTAPLSKNVFPFTPAAPVIAHEFQLQSSGAAARFWYSEIKWDYEPWPEFDTGRSPWLDDKTPKAKFVRAFIIPIDTGGLPVTFDLNLDNGTTVVMGPFTTVASVKTVVEFAFAVPVIIHEFQLVPRTAARVWYDEIQWDSEPWPELLAESSPWTDMGTPGAKFLQGLVIPLDTNGASVTFDLLYDGTSTTVGPFATTAGRKTSVPFSFLTPFIVHEVLLTPRTACRAWYSEVKWVYEPVPELVTTYTTQATDLDLPGFSYQFDCYVAYIGSADAPVLHITTEYGTVDYTLPVSNGVFTRAYVVLQPQKAKWRSFSVTSTGGVRLFLKDCEFRLKPWTDKGNYPSAFQSHHPMGDESRTVGARI